MSATTWRPGLGWPMRVLHACIFAIACAVLAGCANPQLLKRGDADAASFWSGRLALQVEDSASQSFSAGFELKGSAQEGELALFTPLGGTLAVLSWQPGVAQLLSDGKTRSFGSIDELVQQATGSVIPVAALFDWLNGRATEVPGWRADLSRQPEGRVSAHRSDPLPAADLRVVLER